MRAYEAESMFPFFTNLLPEGANRKVVCREKRIDENCAGRGWSVT